MKTYSEKLRDPRWQRKRLEIMERDGFACSHCRNTEVTLNVHHRIYRKNAMPWDYEDEVFITLCEDCHTLAEDVKEKLLMSIGKNRMRDERLLSLAGAMKEDPVELTFLGWSAGAVAEAVDAQLMAHEGKIEKDTGKFLDGAAFFREAITSAVSSLHKALFYAEDRYPNL